MTFFLQKPAIDPSEQPARLPPAGISTFMDGLGAAFSQSPSGLEKNLGVAKRRNEVKAETNDEIINRIGEDEVWRRLADRGLAPEVPALNDTARKLLRDNLAWRQAILEIGKESAKEDPQAWGDVRITDEQIEEETNARLRAEYEDGQAILDMMPSGRGVAEFLGESAAMMADIKNVPFLLLGGGSGSIGRVMAREALINAGAEAAFLPSQFDMAERLDIPDPDVMQQLTTAALAGAGFGLVFEALPRALRYARERNAVTEALPGRSPVQTQVMVDKAEDILAEGRADALEQIARIPETVPRQPPYRLENPINPERPPLILRPEDRAVKDANGLKSYGEASRRLASDSRVGADILPDADRLAVPDAPLMTVARAQASGDPLSYALAQLRAGAAKPTGRKRPAAWALKQLGGVDPGGRLAEELRRRDITTRSHPGLFRRGGLTDADNIPVNDYEIFAMRGVDDGNGYVPQDAWIEALEDEAAGRPWQNRRGMEAQAELDALDAFAEGLDRIGIDWRTASDDEVRAALEADRAQADEMRRGPEVGFLAGERADVPDGLFITRDMAGFLEASDIAAMVRDHLKRRGLDDILTPEQQAELTWTLQQNGGDADYLLSVMNERELRHEKALRRQASERQADANPDPADAGRGGNAEGAGSGAGAEPAPPVAARVDQPADAGPQFERTAAGDQQVAPGIAPVTERQRLEARMNRPMQGGTAAADEGLFDLNARLQTEMFEPDSPAFTERTQSVTQSFRDDIEANGDFDMSVQLEDGRTLSRASEVLDYLDEGDEFADIIALCGRPRGDGA